MFSTFYATTLLMKKLNFIIILVTMNDKFSFAKLVKEFYCQITSYESIAFFRKFSFSLVMKMENCEK